MSKTLMYIQADMHRAINDGRKSFEVSVLDMKELIGAVESARAREQNDEYNTPVYCDPMEKTLEQDREVKQD